MRGWWVVYAKVPHTYLTPQLAVIASSEREALDLAQVWADGLNIWLQRSPPRRVVIGSAVRLCDVPGEREVPGDS